MDCTRNNQFVIQVSALMTGVVDEAVLFSIVVALAAAPQ